jgi:hypothetical protein
LAGSALAAAAPNPVRTRRAAARRAKALAFTAGVNRDGG